VAMTSVRRMAIPPFKRCDLKSFGEASEGGERLLVVQF
jgi:hypothetical protein